MIPSCVQFPCQHTLDMMDSVTLSHITGCPRILSDHSSQTWVQCFLRIMPSLLQLIAAAGPKVYIATKDTGREGSTRLHLDATCAVNLLSWTLSGDLNCPGAEWQIFDPDDLGVLRNYLRAKLQGRGEIDDTDPVHAQQTYLTEEMLCELKVVGVRPYTIKQRFGDAVFIPAGAAHQVRGCSSTVRRCLTEHRSATSSHVSRWLAISFA